MAAEHVSFYGATGQELIVVGAALGGMRRSSSNGSRSTVTGTQAVNAILICHGCHGNNGEWFIRAVPAAVHQQQQQQQQQGLSNEGGGGAAAAAGVVFASSQDVMHQ